MKIYRLIAFVILAVLSQTYPTFAAVNQPLQLPEFTLQIPNPNTINSHRLIFELKPGEEKKEQLNVIINPKEPISLHLYSVEGKKNTKGELTFEPDNSANQKNWISFNKSDFFGSTNSSVEPVIFQVKIPAQATQGNYIYGIALEKTVIKKSNRGIAFTFRVVIPVEITVTNSPKPIPHLSDIKASVLAAQTFTWTSISIFAACTAYFIFASIRDRKKKKLLMQEQNVKPPTDK